MILDKFELAWRICRLQREAARCESTPPLDGTTAPSVVECAQPAGVAGCESTVCYCRISRRCASACSPGGFWNPPFAKRCHLPIT
ncbi:Uncharacterised protein [Burkholderia cepacia]|nr:hypothetical protein DM41_1154 [Burkholderia cepacia ATCC 25416]SPV17258.1 Uncharacterised protein [Burkholderia cepacia]